MIDRYDFPRHFHQLGFPRHLVGISQTLVRICQTLVRICQTLVRICQTLVGICQTLVRISQTLVMISQVFCQLKFPRQQNCLQMCFNKFQNYKYYSSGSISSERNTMAHFCKPLGWVNPSLCVLFECLRHGEHGATIEKFKRSIKEREKTGRFPFFISQLLTLQPKVFRQSASCALFRFYKNGKNDKNDHR